MTRMIIAIVCFMASLAMTVPVIARESHRDYVGHRGYRERPYDRHRHYSRHPYRGHTYTYRGHWRSWNDWDDYARRHPERYRHGRYYREDGHLMFRYCDPDTGGCFFFSIGR